MDYRCLGSDVDPGWNTPRADPSGFSLQEPGPVRGTGQGGRFCLTGDRALIVNRKKNIK